MATRRSANDPQNKWSPAQPHLFLWTKAIGHLAPSDKLQPYTQDILIGTSDLQANKTISSVAAGEAGGGRGTLLL